MIYQQTPGQTSGSSFFEEVIDTSPVSEDLMLGSSYVTFPSQPTESKILAGNELLQNILSTIEVDKKSNRQPHNRRQSKVSSAISESRASRNTAESPKLRKRGRQPRKQAKGQKGLGQQEELDVDDDDLPTDPRQRRMLERNRIAATKCRLRKRDEASVLASREKAMEDQNRSLSACFDSLTAELYYLKMELLKHTNCNCVQIHRYIAREAENFVNGLHACSPAFHTYGVSLTPNYGNPSIASTPDSLNMYSPEADDIPPTGTKPFQQGSRVSEVREDMLGMSLISFNTTPMPRDAMVVAHPLSGTPLVGYGPGFYDNMVPQKHQADEIGWDLYRNLHDSITAIAQ
ncbi:hypothetical protein BFJ70_g16505 [Fusarium oxysporum]|nr:hypothetical protein BFJ70_g16505 [Fusarium oxysporum]